jgi:hypothetical protein
MAKIRMIVRAQHAEKTIRVHNQWVDICGKYCKFRKICQECRINDIFEVICPDEYERYISDFTIIGVNG